MAPDARSEELLASRYDVNFPFLLFRYNFTGHNLSLFVINTG